jgi:L-alanine-DL-glutamate epimerase-like enolase superfamily enzyme
MVGRGFSALKFDVDVPTPYQTDEYNRSLSRGEIEYMASLVRAVREAVGPQVSLAVDCHWNYAVQDAVELARSVEPYDLSWLEDPIPPEHLERIAEVQRHTRTPIAAGENYYYRVQFARLLAPGGLRVLTPDPLKLGLWETKKTAALADASYANLALHNISGPVGTMACAHLAAAIPNFLLLEWHAASVPFFDELLNRYRKPEEGFFE